MIIARNTISASAPTTIARRVPSGRSRSRANARATTGRPTSGAIAMLRMAQNARNSMGTVTTRSRRVTRWRPRASATTYTTIQIPSAMPQRLRKSGDCHSMMCDRMSPRDRSSIGNVTQLERRTGSTNAATNADRRPDEQASLSPAQRRCTVEPAAERGAGRGTRSRARSVPWVLTHSHSSTGITISGWRPTKLSGTSTTQSSTSEEQHADQRAGAPTRGCRCPRARRT